MHKHPIVLAVLDGFGINDQVEGNAIKQAETPNISRFLNMYPNTYIKTSGLDVGLPEGQMGNSEVGHTNIGAGRIVYQEFTRITKSINEGDFFKKEEFLKAVENCRKNNSNLHIYGLLSNGGVHSHDTHLYALLELAKKENFDRVYVHCFLDGRDTPPTSGKCFVQRLQDEIQKIGVGKIATVMGRYYAMDRDKQWDRTRLAYDAMVLGKGETAHDPVEAVETSYKKRETDEFVKPRVVLFNQKPAALIRVHDSIIFFNFRPERARQITRAFMDKDFDGFERENGYFPLYYVCMTQYDESIKNVEIAFKSEHLENTLGEYISELGYTQLRIAETEKYAHVTFFLNGGVEKVYKGEDRILIPSPKVATYDLNPEMSAYEVTDAVVKAIHSGKYDVIILNYANCDMVGHTGIMKAAIKAVEAVDRCLGRVIDAVLEEKGAALVTADHGNAEQMEKDGQPFTAHTTNPTPLIIIGGGNISLKPGKLADIAPTMLDIMGLDKPEEMTGNSLITR